jgi:hypothetical protein
MCIRDRSGGGGAVCTLGSKVATPKASRRARADGKFMMGSPKWSMKSRPPI